MIGWFQVQPATCGEVPFGPAVDEPARVGAAGRRLQGGLHPLAAGAGLRVVAVVDHEPAIIQAMAAADQTHEIPFLHAETIFESQRVVTPRTVRGTTYDLAELVSEEELRRRVQFVWHGVNDEANLRQFLASSVGWAECVRRDPLDRLVLRHDSFEEAP